MICACLNLHISKYRSKACVQAKQRRHRVDEDDEAFRFQIEAIAPTLARQAHTRGWMYAGIVLPGIITLDVLRVALHRCSRDDVFGCKQSQTCRTQSRRGKQIHFHSANRSSFVAFAKNWNLPRNCCGLPKATNGCVGQCEMRFCR